MIKNINTRQYILSRFIKVACLNSDSMFSWHHNQILHLGLIHHFQNSERLVGRIFAQQELVMADQCGGLYVNPYTKH